MTPSRARDTLSRPLRSLRISVTDRCNLRCRYCMPDEDYVWIPREQILSFEEICKLVDVFIDLGVSKVRLTGGEPLLRRDLPKLVGMLASRRGISDLAMTSNGLRLAEHASALRDAGLNRVTISLDTLRPRRFHALTGQDSIRTVLAAIDTARRCGLDDLKINTVVMRGFNDDELTELLEFGKRIGAEVRFIEYMDVGGATNWSSDQVISRAGILGRLEERYGRIVPVEPNGTAPAERFMLPDSTRFGIISSTTAPFCSACDRSRLTCDGMWYLCLYAAAGLDLKAVLRSPVDRACLPAILRGAWEARTDRGAEDRLRLAHRGPLVPLTTLRTNHHLEMHTRGG